MSTFVSKTLIEMKKVYDEQHNGLPLRSQFYSTPVPPPKVHPKGVERASAMSRAHAGNGGSATWCVVISQDTTDPDNPLSILLFILQLLRDYKDNMPNIFIIIYGRDADFSKQNKKMASFPDLTDTPNVNTMRNPDCMDDKRYFLVDAARRLFTFLQKYPKLFACVTGVVLDDQFIPSCPSPLSLDIHALDIIFDRPDCINDENGNPCGDIGRTLTFEEYKNKLAELGKLDGNARRAACRAIMTEQFVGADATPEVFKDWFFAQSDHKAMTLEALLDHLENTPYENVTLVAFAGATSLDKVLRSAMVLAKKVCIFMQAFAYCVLSTFGFNVTPGQFNFSADPIGMMRFMQAIAELQTANKNVECYAIPTEVVKGCDELVAFQKELMPPPEAFDPKDDAFAAFSLWKLYSCCSKMDANAPLGFLFDPTAVALIFRIMKDPEFAASCFVDVTPSIKECVLINSTAEEEIPESDLVVAPDGKENTKCDLVVAPDGKENTECDLVVAPDGKENPECDLVAAPDGKENPECDLVAAPECDLFFPKINPLTEKPYTAAEFDHLHTQLAESWNRKPYYTADMLKWVKVHPSYFRERLVCFPCPYIPGEARVKLMKPWVEWATGEFFSEFKVFFNILCRKPLSPSYSEMDLALYDELKPFIAFV